MSQDTAASCAAPGSCPYAEDIREMRRLRILLYVLLGLNGANLGTQVVTAADQEAAPPQRVVVEVDAPAQQQPPPSWYRYMRGDEGRER